MSEILETLLALQDIDLKIDSEKRKIIKKEEEIVDINKQLEELKS